MKNYNVGDKIGGYEVKRVKDLNNLGQKYIELQHIKTKSRHIHLQNESKENVFGVAFKTTPSDSTGVAHILEHTALCGSKKYPIRDPFFTMIKRSMNTFMNAFTASDWTMYPYASQNEKDFYNLMEVYLDAAFFPNLNEIDFMQEGHRFEFEQMEDSDSKLTITGVVYNEMKGAMSQSSSVMYQRLLQAMYPTTTYGNNAGGEPSDIPNLTYQQFVDFHKTHYHPSNAYFYTYGNLPLERHLKVIENEVLSKFDSIDAHTNVPDEKRFDGPKKFEFFYPLNKEDDSGDKHQVAVSWLTNRRFDMVETLSMKLLSEILLSHDGAPLNRALMESGLGKKLCSEAGYMDDNRETIFTAGLDGVKNENLKAVEELVINTLSEISKKGISKEEIDSAIHQMEFHTREITGSDYPYGLNLFFRFGGSWFHDGDTIEALDFDTNIEIIKSKVAEGRYFEGLIEKYFINNKHRATVILSPDHEMEKRESEKLDKELQELKGKMTADEKAAIVKRSLELKARQEMDEDFSCLPELSKNDLDRKTPMVTPTPKTTEFGGVKYTSYEQNTNGIGYLDLKFNTSHLSEEELVLTPILAALMTECSVGDLSYVEFSEEAHRYTGALWASVGTKLKIDNDDFCGEYIKVRSKALESNIPKMIELLTKVINDFDLSDESRVQTVLKRRLTSLENDILQRGLTYANKMATRGMNRHLYRSEQFGGMTHLEILKDIVKSGDYQTLGQKLKAIGARVFTGNSLSVFAVGQQGGLTKIEAELNTLLNALPKSDAVATDNFPFSEMKIMDAWTTTTPVSYVCKSFKVPNMTHPDGAKLLLLANILRGKYFHPEIREKGGAYGGFSSYSGQSGTFSMMSYRDPHLQRTRNIYDETLGFMDKLKVTQKEIDEAIISIFGSMDAPSSPYGNCASEYENNECGVSETVLQQYRDAIYETKVEDIFNVAKKYLSSENASVSVITSADILKRDGVTDLEVKAI